MKRKNIILLIPFLLLLLADCSREKTETDQIISKTPAEIYGREIPDSNLVRGSLRIKVSEKFAEQLELQNDTKGNLLRTGIQPMNDAIASLGIVRIKRTFPYEERFEARKRARGMHLWYDVEFDRTCITTKAGNELQRIDGIEIIEYRPKIMRIGQQTAPLKEVGKGKETPSVQEAELPFDDPKLPMQWHYYNTGKLENSIAGCDIDVLPAWKKGIIGNQDIIVSVVDGGIDFKHEDLKDNMWHNPDMSGDLVYGYNFVRGDYNITTDEHGTHVAGTIAAVNNNGTGVCGIAGGDYKKGIRGAQLMSCQIFEGENGGSAEEAIVWGADHGAVISQNSWGYIEDVNYIPPTLKMAVDYFIEEAGYDENHRQTGPMAGGIVIFAAGNEGRNIGYPACYEKILSVSALGADYRRAYYTNYGSWVDIAAPGGDTMKGNEILSTLPGNKYGYMQGTSMACPHASGVAALVIAKKGGPGFNSEELKNILTSTSRPIDGYNFIPLGKGLVDAYAAIMTGTGIKPEPITDLTAEASSNNISFRFTLPSDKDSGQPESVIIYYGKENRTDRMSRFEIKAGDHKAGDTMSGIIKNLEFNTHYYIAAIAVDEFRKRSDLSNIAEAVTGMNHAPIIDHEGPLEARLKRYDYQKIKIRIDDPDGHRMRAKLEPAMKGFYISVQHLENSDTLILDIAGPNADAGMHEGTITIRDEYELETELKMKIRIEENHAPEKGELLEDLLFNSLEAAPVKLNCSSYFKDRDGEKLTYKINPGRKEIVDVKTENGQFIITPQDYGSTDVTITAQDALKESAEQTFRVLVRNGSFPMDLYPNPVRDTLHIRSGQTCMASVRLYTGNGSEIYRNDDAEISAFQPLKIDMSPYSGGTYQIRIRYRSDEKEEWKEIRRSIIKL